jgi:hypothetical protein
MSNIGTFIDIPKEAIGPIFAATITGLVAFLGLVISKESKISEFRQAWLDALREDISGLIARIECLRFQLRSFNLEIENRISILQKEEVKPHDKRKINLGEESGKLLNLPLQTAGDIKEDLFFVGLHISRIRLRVNEREAKSFCSTLNEVERTFKNSSPTDCASLEDRFVAESQILLKKEWKRVKRGESVFYVSKMISFFLLLISVVLISIFYIQPQQISTAIPFSTSSGNLICLPTGKTDGH